MLECQPDRSKETEFESILCDALWYVPFTHVEFAFRYLA
jgi:hypothetical protein